MDKNEIAHQLIKLAKDILAVDFPTKDAMDKYLEEHPGADRSNHRVVENRGNSKGQSDPVVHDLSKSFETKSNQDGENHKVDLKGGRTQDGKFLLNVTVDKDVFWPTEKFDTKQQMHNRAKELEKDFDKHNKA